MVLSPTRTALNSEATSELIDVEVRRIVKESHRKADRLLAVHRDKLEALAQALLKAESLNEKVRLSVSTGRCRRS